MIEHKNKQNHRDNLDQQLSQGQVRSAVHYPEHHHEGSHYTNSDYCTQSLLGQHCDKGSSDDQPSQDIFIDLHPHQTESRQREIRLSYNRIAHKPHYEQYNHHHVVSQIPTLESIEYPGSAINHESKDPVLIYTTHARSGNMLLLKTQRMPHWNVDRQSYGNCD